MKISRKQLEILGENPKFCKFFAKMDDTTPKTFIDDNPRRVTRFKACCKEGEFGKITKLKGNQYIFTPATTEEKSKINIGKYTELDAASIEEIRKIQSNLSLDEFINRFNLRIKQAEIANIKHKAIISYLENCFRSIKVPKTQNKKNEDKNQPRQKENKWLRRMRY
jgi:hypothetical protein